jgi:hypothetical protein
MFPALGDRQVRVYLVGQFASMVGSWTLDVTLNLLVWKLTNSPALLGVLNFLLFGPAMVITPLLSERLSNGTPSRPETRWSTHSMPPCRTRIKSAEHMRGASASHRLPRSPDACEIAISLVEP